MKVRGNLKLPPDASIIVPVNAQGDLENILHLLGDITRYAGKYLFEIILVINNYPPEEPPKEIDVYKTLGLKIIDIPNIRKPGEAPGFTARIPGAMAALSDNTIFFDADCHIPNPTALLDWYIQSLKVVFRQHILMWIIMTCVIGYQSAPEYGFTISPDG